MRLRLLRKEHQQSRSQQLLHRNVLEHRLSDLRVRLQQHLLDLSLQGLWLIGSWLLLTHSQHLHLGPRLLGPEVPRRLLRVGYDLHQLLELPVR